MVLRSVETETGLNTEGLEGFGNICRNDNNVFEYFMKVSVLKMFRYFLINSQCIESNVLV
jgi:hypothetical protein